MRSVEITLLLFSGDILPKFQEVALCSGYVLAAGIVGSIVLALGFLLIIALISFMLWTLPSHSPLPMLWILGRLGFVLGTCFGLGTVSDFYKGYVRSALK